MLCIFVLFFAYYYRFVYTTMNTCVYKKILQYINQFSIDKINIYFVILSGIPESFGAVVLKSILHDLQSHTSDSLDISSVS